MKFKIRRSEQRDFEGVFRLLRQLWPDEELDSTALQRVYERALASHSQVYLCVVQQEDVIGFASLTIKNNLWEAGNLGHIDELVVDQGCRGAGIGTDLLHKIIAAARQRGCVRVELDSAFHREKAHEFYNQNGFDNRAYLFSKELD